MFSSARERKRERGREREREKKRERERERERERGCAAWCDLAENRVDSGRLFFEISSCPPVLTLLHPPLRSSPLPLSIFRSAFPIFVYLPFFSFTAKGSLSRDGTRVKGNYRSLRFPLSRWRLANIFGKLPPRSVFFRVNDRSARVSKTSVFVEPVTINRYHRDCRRTVCRLKTKEGCVKSIDAKFYHCSKI